MTTDSGGAEAPTNLKTKAITDLLQGLLDATDKLKHWHDWGRDNEGMIVSSESVFEIWRARDALKSQLRKGQINE